MIVKAPIVQLFAMFMGFSILALECPLPQIQKTRIHRSIVVRIVMLLFQAFLAILFYQVMSVRRAWAMNTYTVM